MTIRRTDFYKDLQEGLNAHFGMGYREHPPEWPMFLDEESTSKAFEEDVLETGFGPAPEKEEGDEYAEDTAQQGWVKRYSVKTVAMMFGITEEAQEDNQYQRLGNKYARELGRSINLTQEIDAANVLNFAATSGYNGGDGVPLLSASHPLLGGGVASNKLATPADFHESSLEDVLILIRRTKDDRGKPKNLRAVRLVGPPEQEYVFERVLMSPNRPGTADNDVNAVKSKGVLRTDPAIITNMVNTSMWLIKTDCPEGAKMLTRLELSRRMFVDPKTGNIEYYARKRYTVGHSDWRCFAGSEGVSA